MPFFRDAWMTLAVAGALCASGAPAQADQTPPTSELAVPVMPMRKGAPPVSRPLAELPAGADRVTPLTLHVRITTRAAGRVSKRRQTVTRTVDRVHVAGLGGGNPARDAAGGVEWLFERNPVDPRRASATYVAHATKTIVTYSDSDLQTMLGIPGWAHILTMGVDPAILREATASSETRTIGGLRFAHMTGGAGHPLASLWWNAEQLLPAEFASGDTHDGTRLAIERASATADLQLVQPAELRFPGYRVVTLADWLEEH